MWGRVAESRDRGRHGDLDWWSPRRLRHRQSGAGGDSQIVSCDSKANLELMMFAALLPSLEHGSLGIANAHEEEIATMSISVKGEFETVCWMGKFAFRAASYCPSHRVWVFFLALNYLSQVR